MANGLPLGLGGAALGNLFTAISDEAAEAVISAALQAGCRTFDTAPHYGNGLSEHRFGHALRGVPRESFVLSTKVGRVLVPDAHAARAQNSYIEVLPFNQRWDYSAAGVRRSVEDSLQRLGLARLDVAYVHDCDAACHGDAYPQVLRQVITEALPELRRMRAEGLVRHIGLGVNDVQVCLDVLHEAELDCLLLAGRYSLLDHAALPALLPLCEQRGVRIALGGVFNSGILATGVKGVTAGHPVRFNYGPAPEAWIARTAAIEAVCDRFQVPLRAAALRFPLAHPAVEIVMAGPQTIAHWQDAVTMMGHAIAPAFWQALRDEALMPAEAPLP
ncbi:aldo/keto reductase [Rhodoferax koreense]|uniref:Aldo/keto reductase n=2 Tax=Rhodoferax koreensis TaxID=1842727 RepID=A0A1P8K2V7_9BURK|nr:aldo/keto reductase [Rhodoferax koreense]